MNRSTLWRLGAGLCLTMLTMLVLVLITIQSAAASTGGDPGADFVLELLRAIRDGRWGWLAGVALIGVVEPIKRLVVGRVKFLSTDLGGLILTFVTAAVAGVAHNWIAGGAWNLELATAIVRNAVIAVGGYTAIKKAVVAKYPGVGKVIGAPLPPEVKPATVIPVDQGAPPTSMSGTIGG